MCEPILSIIIPSYNTSKYVDECLPTFIHQDLFGKVKIYLIDDGATDDTALKIKPYVENYPQLFEFHHKENGGHGSVINYGVFNLVKTKYFKVIDGDDWVNINELIKLVNYLYTTDDDLVLSNFANVYPNRVITMHAIKNKCNLLPFRSYPVNEINSFNITIHSITYKHSIFLDNKIIMPEKVFYEDNVYRIYPSIYIKSISFVDSNVYCYRLGNPNQSVSKASGIKHLPDALQVRKDALSFYEKNISDLPAYLSSFIASVIASGLSVCRTIIVNSKINKKTIPALKKLYNEFAKFPLIVKELKKSKFYRFLIKTHFNVVAVKIAKKMLATKE